MPTETRTVWDVRPGEQLVLDGSRISVRVLDKSGKHARLLIVAPRDISIRREESDQPRAMRGEMTA